jgi:hypothetical protein
VWDNIPHFFYIKINLHIKINDLNNELMNMNLYRLQYYMMLGGVTNEIR